MNWLARIDRASLFLWVALLSLTSNLPAWARPGGGSSYRSSSSSRSSGSSYRSSSSSYHSSGSSHYSSSGHYSGSGGSGGDLFVMLVVIVVVAVVVVGFIMLLEQGKNSSQQNVRHGSTTDPYTSPSDNVLTRLSEAMQAQGPERVELLKQVPKSPGFGCVLLMVASPFMLPLIPIAFVLMFAFGPVLPILLVFGLVKLLMRAQNSTGSAPMFSAESRPVSQLGPLLENDPNFSLPIFREFAVLLYSQAMQERVSNFAHSRPYLSSAAERSLRSRSQAAVVNDVVVGFCHLENAWVQANQVKMKVRFESNYIETGKSGGAQAYVANESWVFARQLGTLTKIPEGASKLTCPGCGYAGEFPSGGECPQCNRTNLQGQLDWVVTAIQVSNLESFQPQSAQGGGVEAGTNLPTLIHPDLGLRRREFSARHPGLFTFEQFEAKVQAVFFAINKAWNERDWTQARPYETDSLFRTHRYWIEDYLRRGQINRLENIRFDRQELSNIVLDAFYESITVRIYASMLDYTVDEKTNQVLYGDNKRPRAFTEYWTFIRRVGHKQAQGTTAQCPSCGAPLDRVNQTGACEYCQSVITKGDFDWVLSNIEQDEVYRLSL